MFDCKGELTFDLSHIKAESKCRYGELTNKSFIVETGRGEGEESGEVGKQAGNPGDTENRCTASWQGRKQTNIKAGNLSGVRARNVHIDVRSEQRSYTDVVMV